MYLRTKSRTAGTAWTVVLIAVLFAAGSVVKTRSAAARQSLHAAPLVWSGGVNPTRADAQPPDLSAVSCPDTGFCAAIDYDYDILTSTDPAAGASSWRITTIPGSSFGPSTIDCLSNKLCLVGDGSGNVLHSTDPTGGFGRWISVHLEDPINSDGFSGMACPSKHLCVVSDDNGNVWASTDPAGTRSAWHHSTIPYGGDDINGPVQCQSTTLCWVQVNGSATELWETSTPLHGGWKLVSGSAPAAPVNAAVSCPVSSFCVRVGDAAAVATASSSSGPWTSGQINGWSPLAGVSCIAAGRCAGTDAAGNVLTSTPHAGSLRWSAGHVSGLNFLGTASCPDADLCVAGAAGGVLVSQHPEGPVSGWKLITIPSLHGHLVSAVSCASARSCIAATERGLVLATDAPLGPGTGWKLVHSLPSLSTAGGFVPEELTFADCPSLHLCFAGDPATPYLEGSIKGMLLVSTRPQAPHSWHGSRLGLAGISCPGAHLCVAVRVPDYHGSQATLAFSRNPTGGAGAWTLIKLHGFKASYSSTPANTISCAGARLCVAAGQTSSGIGAVAVSTDPTNPRSWQVKEIDGSPLDGVNCSHDGDCVAYAQNGAIFYARRG